MEINKKGQGLPINFIVIAAIAIIILIVITIFVISSSSTFGGAVSPAQYSARCSAICLGYQKVEPPASLKNSAYCEQQEMRDGTTARCADTDPCYITKASGSQTKLDCGSGGITDPGTNPGTGPGTFNPLT